MTAQINIENQRQLADYLRHTGLIRGDQQLTASRLSGGVSNRTMLVTASRQQWVIKQSLPRLRVEADWFCDPRRVQVEAAALRCLSELLPAGSVPRFVHEDHEHYLLVMEAVPQPHENWKTMLLRGEVTLRHVTEFAAMLAQLHRESRLQADKWQVPFSNREYFEALRLAPYYSHAAERIPEAREFLGELICETRSLQCCLVHGDFSPKNVLVHRDRLVLLDHEVMHWGDPAFDLGFSLTHLLSKAHHLPHAREAFAGAAHEYWRVYAAGTDSQKDLEVPVVRHTLACLLARVAGKSPLEYLNADRRQKQQTVVCDLIRRPPNSVSGLIRRFVAALG